MSEREWIKWRDRRPPNEAGAYRYRCQCEILGMVLRPEWTEEMRLVGMGYSDNEWWPLSPCYWDGYRRYITHEGLEWSELREDDPNEIVWGGLYLLPCPFTGNPAKVEAVGRYIGAPLWRSEALYIGSAGVPKRRFTKAQTMVDVWNTRYTLSSAEREIAMA